MSTDLLPSRGNVYTGAWIDRSRGTFAGATLTVTSEQGAILVAFLAIFVSFAAQQLWGLICFFWHLSRARGQEKKILEHQQDLSLRNSETPLQASWYFIQIAWAWKSRLDRLSWWRFAVLPTVLPLLLSGVVLVAGILSSQIVRSTAVNVLIYKPVCGLWDSRAPGLWDATSEERLMRDNHMSSLRTFSGQYGKICYGTQRTSKGTNACRIFSVPRIRYSTTLTAPCPFDSSVCSKPERANLQMETEIIDTNKILGINTRLHNIELKKTTVCAPLKAEKLMTTSPDTHTEKIPPHLTLRGRGLTRVRKRHGLIFKDGRISSADRNTTILNLVT